MATMKNLRFVSIVTTTTSAILIIVGFLLPPMGVIDNSVFSAVGLLLAFKTVDMIPQLINKNGGASVKIGDTTISVHGKPQNEDSHE